MQSYLKENENILLSNQDISQRTLQLIGQNVGSSVQNGQDTRSDALESIRQHFDAGLSNFQESSHSVVQSSGVPTFTEFVHSTNMFLNRLGKKLDVLLEHMKHPPSTQCVSLDNSVLSMFPLKSIEAIKGIEENLQNYEYNIKILVEQVYKTLSKEYLQDYLQINYLLLVLGQDLRIILD
ncbi:uncharacterized protein LOC112689784 [Sipha flava]|uniref:Uncharacterized protein LOC112689784 n=1 Tax=Sipha flava TaxID=143950 RepID=A0A8B8G975_9HEMI|nr:uncharacterized protein LOC112689784 [Sipha flava]